ncbi:hypothetical protein CTA2_11886 [Colletotrichum tanaceti]|uniref:Uncharacterized protein n=1 Tax=Colletotrichum tanaceti TaxID=1306861 RepID=A0A4U6XQK9_9PEZI|nr:hypothetical protein CTA2_11886 [Colletotrichum tanaceti]TKW58094.1 hypothetical protein CTA1_11123 [Colletotrichum tanaceti]
MCQNVFYTYSCSHMECVTYRCLKCNDTARSICMHRQEAQYTTLGDQVCHDCNETSKQRHHRGRARRGHRLREQMEDELQTESQARGHLLEAQTVVHEQGFLESHHHHRESQQAQRAQQAQQPQTRQQPQMRQDAQSSSPDGKTIRPLESNKLGNMQFHGAGGAVDLPPHGLYQFYTGQ